MAYLIVGMLTAAVLAIIISFEDMKLPHKP
jgi:hypothetical protein